MYIIKLDQSEANLYNHMRRRVDLERKGGDKWLRRPGEWDWGVGDAQVLASPYRRRTHDICIGDAPYWLSRHVIDFHRRLQGYEEH